jgi:hypothetical protein
VTIKGLTSAAAALLPAVAAVAGMALRRLIVLAGFVLAAAAPSPSAALAAAHGAS